MPLLYDPEAGVSVVVPAPAPEEEREALEVLTSIFNGVKRQTNIAPLQELNTSADLFRAGDATVFSFVGDLGLGENDERRSRLLRGLTEDSLWDWCVNHGLIAKDAPRRTGGGGASSHQRSAPAPPTAQQAGGKQLARSLPPPSTRAGALLPQETPSGGGHRRPSSEAVFNQLQAPPKISLVFEFKGLITVQHPFATSNGMCDYNVVVLSDNDKRYFCFSPYGMENLSKVSGRYQCDRACFTNVDFFTG